MNNRNAQRAEYNGITFDSLLERDTYISLQLSLPNQHFQAIKVHYPILYKPATKRFPAQYWKVDFYLPTLDLLIEAKGRREPEWMQKLKFIDYTQPNVLSRLLVVARVGDERICKGLTTTSINELPMLVKARCLQLGV